MPGPTFRRAGAKDQAGGLPGQRAARPWLGARPPQPAVSPAGARSDLTPRRAGARDQVGDAAEA
jgi:hypothetical protein